MESYNFLAKQFAEDHPLDAARVLEKLPSQDASAYLTELSPRLAAKVLQSMISSNAAECIAQLSPSRSTDIIAALPLNSAATILRRFDPERRAEILPRIPSPVSTLLVRLLRYPENSAGAFMDPRALALPEDITATEALARVRRTPRHALYYIYVLDREQKLVGVMNLRELMLAHPKSTLGVTMHREVMTIPALAGRRAIVENSGWHDVHALPVVDNVGTFLGVLRYETLRTLERDAATKPSPAEGALAAVLNLGELCWVGLAGILSDLTASMVPRANVMKNAKGPGHG